MPTFRLRADHSAVDVFRPAGSYESMHVEPGESVEVPGDVLSQTADAVVVGPAEDPRIWPLAVWELVEPVSAESAKRK